MHSAFIWASCHNKLAVEAIGSLVSSPVSPDNLPEYFWAHLEKDLELLVADTGKGLDECIMIMHLVLKRILTVKPPTGILVLMKPIFFSILILLTIVESVSSVSSLRTREAREVWEDIFNQHYISPVLGYNVSQAIASAAKDNQQSNNVS